MEDYQIFNEERYRREREEAQERSDREEEPFKTDIEIRLEVRVRDTVYTIRRLQNIPDHSFWNDALMVAYLLDEMTPAMKKVVK